MRRIFVSHGAKTQSAKRLRNRVLKALKSKGFHTWEQEDLEEEPSGHWPKKLDDWIAECDGAVILFCPDALKSAWVQAETVRLCFRKSRNEHFPLIPIAVEDTPPKKLPAYIKETTQLQWSQWWKMSTRPRLVSDIVKYFEQNIVDTSAADPLTGLFISVVARLSGVNDHCFNEAARYLDIDLGGSDFQHSHHARLIDLLATRKMSLTKVAGALKLLRPLDPETRLAILQDITVMRLSLGNLIRIPQIVREDDPSRRVFGLAASRLLVAQLQIRRPFRYGKGADYHEYAVARGPDNSMPDIDAQLLSMIRRDIEPTEDFEGDLKRYVSTSTPEEPSMIAIVPDPPDCAASLMRLRQQYPILAFGVYGTNESRFSHEVLGKDICAEELEIVTDFTKARAMVSGEH